MKRIRIVGLCLVAVFAMSAVIAASSASAAFPQFTACAKVVVKESGQWNNKECTIPSKHVVKAKPVEGSYELESWEHLKKKTLSGKNGVSTLLSYIPESEAEFWKGGTVVGTVTCKNAKSTGEITGEKTTTTTVTFAGCTSEGKKCTSLQALEKVGDITTNKLETVMGFESGPGSRVITEVRADDGSEGVGNQAEFNCQGTEISTNGTLLGVNTGNINKIQKEGTTTFAANAKNGQEVVFAEVPNASAGVWGPGTESIHVLKTHATPPGVNIPSTEETVAITKGEAMIQTEPIGPPPVPKWWEEGKLLTGSEPIAEATTVTEPFKLILTEEKGAVEIGSIQCSEVKIKGGAIEAPSSRSETAVEYAGCKVYKAKPNSTEVNTQCQVVGEHFVTNPLKGTLEGPPGSEKLKFVPKVGGEIGGFEIEGASCSFKGLFHADGDMVCNYEEVEKEKVEHPEEFTTTSGSEVTLSGPASTKPKEGVTVSYKVHLSSGKMWSAF